MEVPFDAAYVLDLRVAQRAVGALRQRLSTLKRLVAALGEADEIEVYNAKRHKHTKVYRKRVVTGAVAAALGVVAPDERLFVSYVAWKASKRRKAGSEATEAGLDPLPGLAPEDEEGAR